MERESHSSQTSETARWPSDPGGACTRTSQSAASSKALFCFWVSRAQFLLFPNCSCTLLVLFVGFWMNCFVVFDMQLLRNTYFGVNTCTVHNK